jgi:hypothetical protein
MRAGGKEDGVYSDEVVVKLGVVMKLSVVALTVRECL